MRHVKFIIEETTIIPRAFATIALLVLLGAAPSPLASEPIFIVVPNVLTNAEGDTGAQFPFFSWTPLRFQQVYAASQFSVISQGGGWITSLGFRVDTGSGESYGKFVARDPSVQLNLSTTLKQPGELSKQYAENVGRDDTVVFGPAYFAMTEFAITRFGGPQPWSPNPELRLSHPFFYDPNRGNLLLDTRNLMGSTNLESTGNALDATQLTNLVSAVEGSLSTNMGRVDLYGLVTRFEIIPAPSRPSMAIALSLATAVVSWPSNAVGFVLESTAALKASNQWKAVTNAPVVSGTNNIVTNRLSGTSQFFRLRYVLNL